ncbi:heterokaryon incompatibility protein-domain-containing protein [Epithele typhae]|uniref:heterokaryon incompatibility protein-domain-containing protein n=1 Tax=Epithele typhae TaxID=378194 RepID=UPI00200806C5|nr:heterokaryon incompatibility protein-domain-containing protein [Epithele typhae]KAH9920850.1 heterokaryon incompatibility protein-domain-containing protein [Epithele typhae]
MWLLRADDAALVRFNSPEDVPEGYAILSHVWGDQEDSFQQVQLLNSQSFQPGCSTRDLLSPKIRMCCMLAESYGYRWIWADTTCINKESSAELSEGINSMFSYYAASQICVVYLHDVSSDGEPWLPGSDFRRSRWHTRGWTLQELLAPEMVVFLSREWKVLGTKASLATLIFEITTIPVSVLKFKTDVTSISIAQRMSWASRRQTTREEDAAYCLLGLFGVTMPPLYGEGYRALHRLQEELMKTSSDTSIWAFGVDPVPSKSLQALRSLNTTFHLVTRRSTDPILPIFLPMVQTYSTLIIGSEGF